MSGTFPSTPAPSALKIQSYQPTRVSISHNLRRSVRSNGAQRWVITADWVGLTRAQFAPIQAFVLAQRGQWDSFTAALPAHKLPQGTASGTPQVNGANQQGRSLTTRGWTAGLSSASTGTLKAGDFIAMAGQTKVYMVTADVTADAFGLASVFIEPALLAVPADGATIAVRNVAFTLALGSDTMESAVAPGGIYNFSLQFVEAF
jgi:hypothetical protein